MKQHELDKAKKEAKKRNPNEPPKVKNILIPEVEHLEPPKGERYSKCTKCGEIFEQAYYKNRNMYSAYKVCPKCRAMQSKEKLQTVSTVEYVPFEWQRKAEELLDTHKYLVLACGARTGKDRFSNMMLIKYTQYFINENRHIYNMDLTPSFYEWVVAPTYDMAKQNFRELRKYLPKDWIRIVRESDMSFELINGGIIEVKSAYDAESLVGVGLDFCTITEADRIKDLESVWGSISRRLVSPFRGREKDRNGAKFGCGKCIINSSPTGKGFFYEMYKRGQPEYINEYDPDYASLNLPSYENPFVKEELEQVKHTKFGDITQFEMLKRQMSPERFARDIMGQFADDTGTVFTEFRQKCVMDLFSKEISMRSEERRAYIKEWQSPIAGHTYRIGYDPATGSSADDPAIVVRDMNTNRIVWIESLYGKNYDQQFDEISIVSRRYNYARCCWLRTGHTAIENQLAKRGVMEIPLNEQGGKKAEYIQSLEQAVQNSDVQVLEDGSKTTEKLISQMEDYTEKNGKYSNALEPHDDFVSALYAAYNDYSVKEADYSGFSTLFGGF